MFDQHILYQPRGLPWSGSGPVLSDDWDQINKTQPAWKTAALDLKELLLEYSQFYFERVPSDSRCISRTRLNRISIACHTPIIRLHCQHIVVCFQARVRNSIENETQKAPQRLLFSPHKGCFITGVPQRWAELFIFSNMLFTGRLSEDCSDCCLGLNTNVAHYCTQSTVRIKHTRAWRHTNTHTHARARGCGRVFIKISSSSGGD